MQEIEYDRWGRMKYNPEYHPNQGKEYTVQELAYLCRHYERGQVKTLALDLGRTETSIRQRICNLRKDGLFEHYKSLG